MDCTTARTVLSARMDGREPVGAPEADRHARACPSCRRWLVGAGRLDALVRSARVGPLPGGYRAAQGQAEQDRPAQDWSARIVAASGVRGLGRRVAALRLALGLTAALQIAIGAAGLVDALGLHGHGEAAGGLIPGGHMTHEVVAFNIAFGAALLVVAWRIERARAQVPLLLTFLGVLVAFSVADLAAGEVGWVRVATHAPIVVGLALVVWAVRIAVEPPGPAHAEVRGVPAEPAAPATDEWATGQTDSPRIDSPGATTARAAGEDAA